VCGTVQPEELEIKKCWSSPLPWEDYIKAMKHKEKNKLKKKKGKGKRDGEEEEGEKAEEMAAAASKQKYFLFFAALVVFVPLLSFILGLLL